MPHGIPTSYDKSSSYASFTVSSRGEFVISESNMSGLSNDSIKSIIKLIMQSKNNDYSSLDVVKPPLSLRAREMRTPPAVAEQQPLTGQQQPITYRGCVKICTDKHGVPQAISINDEVCELSDSQRKELIAILQLLSKSNEDGEGGRVLASFTNELLSVAQEKDDNELGVATQKTGGDSDERPVFNVSSQGVQLKEDEIGEESGGQEVIAANQDVIDKVGKRLAAQRAARKEGQKK
jgi:hypothetical protein